MKKSRCPSCGGTKTVDAVDNDGVPYVGCATCVIRVSPDALVDSKELEQLRADSRFLREKVASYVGVDCNTDGFFRVLIERIHEVFGDGYSRDAEISTTEDRLRYLLRKQTTRRKALAARLAMLEPNYDSIEDEVVRRCGDIVCESCGLPLYDHPEHPGISIERVLCDGSLAHL